MKRLSNGMTAEQPNLAENSIQELKVIFLGDGGAGKSHIIARLLLDGGQTTDFPDIATPGIQIKNKTYNIDGREFLVHFWDFGGQEILHSMHRMFLTRNALYVVILDARNGNQQERARYWLHNLRSFAKNASALLVLNKVDMNQNASVDERSLRELYPTLTEVVRMSTLIDSRERFENGFHAALKRQIAASASAQPVFPPSWSCLKEALQNMSEDYIRGRDYQILCDKCGISDNQDVRRNLLEWFSDLGVGVCYGGSRSLENYVILRTDRIINALYAILWNRIEETRNGVVQHSAIYHLLSTPQKYSRFAYLELTYDPMEVDYVLHVMRKFRLSFPIDDEKEFIPMLCDGTVPSIVYQYASDPKSLEFRMRYEFLHTNVLHHLMVELRHDLDLDNVWLTGARFFSGTLGLSAIVCVDGNLIRILIRSRNATYSARHYLQLIRGTLERISDQMGLMTPKNEIVYKADGAVEAFDYDMLTEMLADGLTTIFSRKFRRNIAIQDILGQTDGAERDDKKRLLQDIVAACGQIQDNGRYWSVTEDQRNAYLRDMLRVRGYIVMDQTLSGFSRTTRYSGELDLEIRKEAGVPWAIYEGVTLRGSGLLRYWEDHLQKLLKYYTANAELAFLVCYVECSKEQFLEVCDTYLSRLRNRESLDALVQCTPIKKQGKPESIAAVQCIYDLDGFPYEIFHIFVRMGK